MNSTDELERVLQLLQIEQEEDRQQYKEKVLKSSLSERKQQGVSWYPIVIKESYYGVGERLILEIERPTNTEVPNLFQTGRVASLFSNFHNEGIDNPSIAGVVSAVRPNGLKLTLFVDELPEWVDQGKMGLDLLFDETSYKEMEGAIHRVIKAKNNRLAQLREILLGHSKPNFLNKYKFLSPILNESQNEAVKRILNSEDIAIVHGPPGTGKTTTLIEAIKATLENEKQVLVCAPSNAAVDLLTEKLNQAGVSVLRFGNPARVNEEMLGHTLDVKVSLHKDFKEIKKLRKEALEYRNLALKYKRHFGKEERNQRKLLLDESRKIQLEALKIENYIIDDIVEKSQVITATLVGSSTYILKNKSFNTVFIDEAAQALEPATWIPISKADRVVFAGDHYQLPPTIKSLDAAKGGLHVTLFEKTILRQEADVMLEIQYRMNEKIMGFSNEKFYKSVLKADDTVKDRVLNQTSDDHILNQPVEFIDTSGSGFAEKFEKEGLSIFNPEEGDLLLKHFTNLVEQLVQTGVEVNTLNVGIISPYKAQVNYLKEKVVNEPGFKSIRISVNTVDGFQGQERDIIYISLVRSNENGEIGFLNDTRRMNVAMTRAKKKLVVFGDSATLSSNAFYNDFLSYIDKIQAYKSAWEFI